MDTIEKENRKSRRDEFLLHLYDKLWDSIDRSESGMWQFVALYAIIAGLVIAQAKEVVTWSNVAIIGLFVSFWGMNIAINSGQWFNRNRLFVINIEKQFLHPDDIGRILPASYQKRKPRLLNTLNRIHFIAFFATAIWSVYFGWSNSPWLLLVIFLIGFILTVNHAYSARKSIQDFIKETNPDK